MGHTALLVERRHRFGAQVFSPRRPDHRYRQGCVDTSQRRRHHIAALVHFRHHPVGGSANRPWQRHEPNPPGFFPRPNNRRAPPPGRLPQARPQRCRSMIPRPNRPADRPHDNAPQHSARSKSRNHPWPIHPMQFLGAQRHPPRSCRTRRFPMPISRNEKTRRQTGPMTEASHRITSKAPHRRNSLTMPKPYQTTVTPSRIIFLFS